MSSPQTPTRARPPEAPSLESIAAPVCAAHGVDLVDVRYAREPGGAVVRVLVERPGADPATRGSGVTLEDCSAISRDLSAALDVHEGAVSGAYRLEVGSPGIERPLVRAADFARFAGREVKIQTRQPVGGRRRFHGVLAGIDGDVVKVDEDGTAFAVPRADIVRAHLVHRF